MAIPGTNPPVQIARILQFGNGNGLRHRRQTPYDKIEGSNSAPPGIIPIGEDTIQFSLTAAQSLVIPFPNLPRQQSSSHPLKQQATTIWVPTGGKLQFTLQPTLTGGALLSCSPQVLDYKNTVVNAGLLGSHLWREFRVAITDGGGGSAGAITGRLSLVLPVPGDSNRPLRGIIG